MYMHKFLGRIFQVIFSAYFYALFCILASTTYVVGIVRCRDNAEQWRNLARWFVDHLFTFACIRIRVNGLDHIPEGPVIFAANHQSYIDGLLLMHALRRPFVALTAPHGFFPGIFNAWFQKMGYIPVQRDVFEELKYRHALDRKAAVNACIDILNRGTSLLIFPEGRREYARRLLPFHGGVAKIAHASRVPVVPITIRGASTFMRPHHFLLTPGRLSIEVLPPLDIWKLIPPDYIDQADHVERLIAHRLPRGYFSERSAPHRPQGIRAAFFDLDGTIAKQNVYMIVLARYIFRNPSWRAFTLLPKLAARRLVLKHGPLFQYAMRLLSGIHVATFLDDTARVLNEQRDIIFSPFMLALVQQHLHDGNKVIVISEEPSPVLEAVLHFLDLEGYGTDLEIVDGHFTGRILGSILKDEAKKRLVLELAHRENIDLSRSYAYGNTWHDYPMLRTVGHATLVRPPRALARRGKQLGFRVIEHPDAQP
jgi:1-acyl-sn-glycerol-3-phosphate acyltransferase